VNPSAPTPVLDPLGNLGYKPSPHRTPRKAGHHFTDSFNNAQFRDSLAILHDLVFELRQEVEDLHFRLQATDEKVAIFLQTLSSMHEALSSDPAETTLMEEPTVATGEGQDKAQRPTEMEQEKDEQESNADGTACDVKDGRQWADHTMYVEEEPWTKDLHVTWPGYLPSV
jgi:hypothetical protein